MRLQPEDQLGALGLVVNVIVLWNTLYINAALEQLQAEGYPIQSDDVARLSPLVFEHINLLGRYAFAVPDSVLRDELRPLRNPAESIEDVAQSANRMGTYSPDPVFRSVNPEHPQSYGLPLRRFSMVLDSLSSAVHQHTSRVTAPQPALAGDPE